ncbi:MAG: hypothetical protein GYB64_03655 [Chloroflexi bacterium]|nr:hypothetical protein [Chloroflexota bacterium]
MRNRHFLIFIVLAAGLLTACMSGAQPTPPTLDDTQAAEPTTSGGGGEPAGEPQVVATVNGEPIYLENFQRELARFEAGLASLGAQPDSEEGYQQQVLNLLVERELIRQYAVENGIAITDEQVQSEIDAMIAENGEEFFNGWLNTNYYTIDEFREAIRVDLTTQTLLQDVVNDVPAEVQHVNARHILVNSEAEANEVLERLEAGESFGELAAEYSVDVTTRDNAGDLGWFPRGGLLVQEVEEVAFSMAPGERSGVVASDWGYHIVETIAFEDARPVDEATRQRLVRRAVENWIGQLRADAEIQQLIDLPL